MSNKSQPFAIWFTGLSGSGKTTLSSMLKTALLKRGIPATIIDGDDIRTTISKDLGFSKEDIAENHRRVLALCQSYQAQKINTIVATISPHHEVREKARKNLENVVQVYCACSLDICSSRDPKGLYVKVARGDISNFIGVKTNYETPANPDIVVNTDTENKNESLKKILNFLKLKKYI